MDEALLVGGSQAEGSQAEARETPKPRTWLLPVLMFLAVVGVASVVLLSGQYWKDVEQTINAAHEYLIDGPEFPGENYTQMVVFDIDETSLSNLQNIENLGFGVPPDKEKQLEYFNTSTQPAIPGADKLFRVRENGMIERCFVFKQDLRKKGFSVAFITGRKEETRSGTSTSLYASNFGVKCREKHPKGKLCYHVLIMRDSGDDRDAAVYKSEERKNLQKDFEIVASIGDQWSDLFGDPRPSAIFKLPNPFYYLT